MKSEVKMKCRKVLMRKKKAVARFSSLSGLLRYVLDCPLKGADEALAVWKPPFSG